MGNLISGQDAVFMMEALVEAEAAAARGDYGIGAVVVHDGKIISRAGNRIISSGGFQWQHAENLALRQIESTNHFKSPLVRELSVYTTLGPCPQCWGTLLVRGIGKIVIGTEDSLARPDYKNIPKIFIASAPERVFLEGKAEEECREIFWGTKEALDRKLGF